MGSPVVTVSISIITVCLNAEKSIKRALQSVSDQRYKNLEYLIIDGGSTDDTLAIIDRYRQRVDYLVSEPDGGLYQAMNKGVEAATGDVIFFLNADDRFCDPMVVADIAAAFAKTPSLDWVYGDVLLEEVGGPVRAVQPPTVNRRMLARWMVRHQSLFARKATLTRTGGFYEGFKVVSDLDWEMQNARLGVRSHYLRRDVAYVALDGVSGRGNYQHEKRAVMRKHYNAVERFFWRTLPRLVGK